MPSGNLIIYQTYQATIEQSMLLKMRRRWLSIENIYSTLNIISEDKRMITYTINNDKRYFFAFHINNRNTMIVCVHSI